MDGADRTFSPALPWQVVMRVYSRKMFTVGLAMIVVSGLCVGISVIVDVKNVPREQLRIPSPFWDFKKVAADSDLKHTFVLENTGDKQIKLLNATGNCGCAALSQVDNIVLPPGETLDFPVRWHPGSRPGRKDVLMMVEYTMSDSIDGNLPMIHRSTMRLAAEVVLSPQSVTDSLDDVK